MPQVLSAWIWQFSHPCFPSPVGSGYYQQQVFSHFAVCDLLNQELLNNIALAKHLL